MMKRLILVSIFTVCLQALAAPVMGGEIGVKGELIRVKADDGMTLNGVVWTPESGQARVGVALATGTGGEFYSSWWRAERFVEAGYLVVSLNRRDHGANFGYYNLEPSTLDHRYAVDLLMERGVEQVVLVGQSYGTVTVPYYVMATNDRRIKGMILTAPLGDLRVGTRIAVGGAREVRRACGQGASDGQG